MGEPYKMGESYENMAFVFNCINYNHYKFMVVADFKMLHILLGTKGPSIGDACFLCWWNQDWHNYNWDKKDYLPRKLYQGETANIENPPLILRSKVSSINCEFGGK